MKTTDITIIVHSTDKFSDCWDPFFKLMGSYWPGCRYPILLNTETQSYAHGGLDIQASRISSAPGASWPTWSESLLRCLDSVRTDIVLFMLDDFFINGPVDAETLDYCIGMMRDHSYSSITLTEHGKYRAAVPGPASRLLAIRQDARYRLNTSPALWRVSALRRYLKPAENAWQFEVFGSWRARRTPDTLLLVDPASLKNNREGVIPYFRALRNSGIVKGRWQRGIEELFRNHDIQVDFSIRGFHEPLPSVLNKYYVLRNLTANPRAVIADWLRDWMVRSGGNRVGSL